MTRNIQGVLKYAFTTPTRDGYSWKGWCASFVQRALNIGAVGDAIVMYRKAKAAGKIRTDKNPPVGAVVFWGVGAKVSGYHVTISLGSGVVLGTSTPKGKPRAWDKFNTLGVFKIDDYQGLPYLGWTDWLAGVGSIPTGPASGPEYFREWQSGILRQYGYTDAVDNFPLTNTYRAIQRAGGTPARDGWPGVRTWRNFMQRIGW